MQKIPQNIDKSWTLFLDRDGVINQKLENDYVKTWNEFVFKKGTLEALKSFAQLFGRIIIVTNQQGIGKGFMSYNDLKFIHKQMLRTISEYGGRVDGVYYCPHLKTDNCLCRKPNTQMALDAQNQFPEIEFSKSVLIGDSDSDIEFGNRLGMKTIKIDSSANLLDLLI